MGAWKNSCKERDLTMKEYVLTTPLRDEDVRQMRIGDVVYLTGHIFTSRDMAHLKYKELLALGQPLPKDFRGAAVFHAGPVCGWHMEATAHWPNDLYSYGTLCRHGGENGREGGAGQGRHGR